MKMQEKDEKPSIQQYRRAEGSMAPKQSHQPSIECINQHTLKNLNFSVLQILFFFYLRKYSNILRDWIFDFHEL